MKFKNKTTGVMLTVTNEFVLEQIRKSTEYEEVKEVRKEEPKIEKVDKKSK